MPRLNLPMPARVFCDKCGRTMPRLLKTPIPQDLNVPWDDLVHDERWLLAGIWLRVGRRIGPTAAFKIGEATIDVLPRHRAYNAMRRLVPCGWVERVGWGTYRLTQRAVDKLTAQAASAKRLTLTQLSRTSET